MPLWFVYLPLPFVGLVGGLDMYRVTKQVWDKVLSNNLKLNKLGDLNMINVETFEVIEAI